MLFNCQTGVYSTHDDGAGGAKAPNSLPMLSTTTWLDQVLAAARLRRLWAAILTLTGGCPSGFLGEMDQSEWKIGLSGKPESPWKQSASIPLESTKSGAFFALSGNNPTTVNGLYKF